MRRLAQCTSLLLALLWMPVTSHCLLESVGALPEFLHCDDVCASENGGTAADQDGCAVIESATCKTQERIAIVAPLILAITAQAPLATPPSAGLRDSTAHPPPELSWLATGWQFSLRAASPPRAPSFIS